MTVSRGVLFVGGAALLAAWFAAAADRQESVTPPAAPPERSALDRAESLARDIESQASRLRARLASAPEPTQSGRNPFVFDERRAVAPASTGFLPDAAAETPAVVEIPEPMPLTLSGIAEEDASGTRVRIAVLSGLGDVFLAREGDTIMSRYEIVAVGADAAELKDLTTGRTIRLGLR